MTDFSYTTLTRRGSYFWTPEYLDVSAWIEHIPFAFWIIEVAKPKIVVELGVHNGTSYFAFCQAIKTLNLNATSYGVDTWRGDEHAGFYSDDVFNKVAGYNAHAYARFSNLIRSTFDEAKDYFTDGSIDLLHIDGLHTYEAVKHDFDNWFPKLAKNAIVVFHDINVRERNFGVFKLWEELKKQYAHFQFDFGNGLGILTIGEIHENELSILFNEKTNTGDYYLFLRNLFFDRGHYIKAQLDYSLALEREKSALNEEKNNFQSLNTAHDQLAEHYNSLTNANKEATEKCNLLAQNNKELAEKNDALAKRNDVLTEKNEVLTEKNELLAEKNEVLTGKNEVLTEENEVLAEKNEVLTVVNNELTETNNILSDALRESTETNKTYEIKHHELTEITKVGLNEANASFKNASDELTRLKSENQSYANLLKWYNATYENRSLPGIIKEKLKRSFKNFYINRINWLLQKESIKNKYAATYAIEYVKENGLKYSLRRMFALIRKNGFKSISKEELRKKALKKISNKSIRVLPVKEEINIDLIKKSIEAFTYRPKISIIFPTYNTKPELLALAIQSVKEQLYTNWELCIVDDGSTNGKTIDFLKAYQQEPNINIRFLNKNVGISEASNAAIKMTTGEFIALMDHDDEITIDALYHIVNLLHENGDADIIYSDECKVDEHGVLSDYFFKPQWSPELLINMMYIGHLTVYRKQFLLDKVGLFRKEYDFSQDYDLALRATEKTSKIYHIDKVIYHWRITEGSSSQGDKPYARISNLAALKDAARRRNIKGEVIELPVANRLKIETPSERRVSIIIPTDSYDNLKETIESILNCTSYTNYEILPVTNSRLIPQIQESIHSSKVSYVTYDKPYNFSDKCNQGALHATGDVLIFFNDDVRPLEKDWLENLIEFFEIPEIGGISPKLIYEDDSIQYAGMAAGVRNLVGTTFHSLHRDSTHYLNFPQLVRNVSILSGACLAVKTELFNKINGYDSINTPIGHSDVDLSFKILEAGYRCVYTPYATLRHIGHLSLKTFEEEEKNSQKKIKKDKADIFLLKRWGKYLNDPYFPTPFKNHVYHDSREPYHVYAPKTEINTSPNCKDILLISHDLTFSGAPLMLLSIAKILKELGYFVVVTSPHHGPLQKVYEQNDIPVILDELVLRQHPSFEKFAKNFDYIICNTIVCWPAVKQMHNITKNIWWIHEGKGINQYFQDEQFMFTLRNAKNIVGISDYSISFIKPFNKHITKIFNYFDGTTAPVAKAAGNQKLIFSLIGSIEPRKGQLLLINAIKKIKPELLAKIEIWIIGRTLHPDYYAELVQESKSMPVIKILGEKNHNECMQFLQQSDVILGTAVDEPFGLSLMEGLSMSKTCIVSSHTGLAELMKDGVNGFIFESGNTFDLSKKIEYILQNRSQLETVGKNGRETFENFLTRDKAVENWKNYIEHIVTEVNG